MPFRQDSESNRNVASAEPRSGKTHSCNGHSTAPAGCTSPSPTSRIPTECQQEQHLLRSHIPSQPPRLNLQLPPKRILNGRSILQQRWRKDCPRDTLYLENNSGPFMDDLGRFDPQSHASALQTNTQWQAPCTTPLSSSPHHRDMPRFHASLATCLLNFLFGFLFGFCSRILPQNR